MKYYSVPDIARNLYVRSATVYRWIVDGKLKAMPGGAKKIISEDALCEFLDQNEAYKAVWYPDRTIELSGYGYLVYMWGSGMRKTIVNVRKNKKFANPMEVFERALDILNDDREKQGLPKLCFEEVNFKPLGNPGNVDILEG